MPNVDLGYRAMRQRAINALQFQLEEINPIKYKPLQSTIIGGTRPAAARA